MIVPIVAQAISDGGYVLTAQPLKTCILFIRWTNDRVVHAASGIKDRHIPAKNLKVSTFIYQILGDYDDLLLQYF